MVLPSMFYWLSMLLYNTHIPTGLENPGVFFIESRRSYIKYTKTYATACTWKDILLNILLVSELYHENFALQQDELHLGQLKMCGLRTAWVSLVT